MNESKQIALTNIPSIKRMIAANVFRSIKETIDWIQSTYEPDIAYYIMQYLL